MGYVVPTLKLGVFLAIAADLPLVTGEMVDAIVERYEGCGKPALTVAVPMETKAKLGMCIEYSFKVDDKDVVPVGINVINGHKRYGDEWLDQDILPPKSRRISREHQHGVGTAVGGTIAL